MAGGWVHPWMSHLDPMWLFLGGFVGISRVPLQCSAGVLAPSSTTRTPKSVWNLFFPPILLLKITKWKHMLPPVWERCSADGILISDGFVSTTPSFYLTNRLFSLSIVFSLPSLLPVSSGAANTDGSYHGTDEGEMASMCFQCMRLNLSQHEPRHSIKHKHQTAKCLISGQLDLCSSIRRRFTFI